MSLSIRRRLVALTALAAIALSGAVVAITLLARRTDDQRFARARETVLREAERLRDTDDDPLGESPAAASALAIDPFARVSTGILDGALHDPRTGRPLAAGLRDPVERASRASLRTGLAAVAEDPARDARVIAAAAVLPEGGFAWAAMHVPSPRGVERWQLGVWALSASMVLLVILALQTVFALRAGARTLNRSLATLSTDLGARVERPQVAELRDVSDGIAALADKLQLARREHDRLSAELASRERLASLGRVAAGIAHEVRNPLASIKLRTDLAQRVPNVPEAVAKDLRDVSGEIDRLDRLVTDLLAVARRRRTERAPADLAVLIRERVDQLTAWARERDVSLEVVVDVPTTAAVERDSIARAVDNLLRNAIEASPVGESVCVSLSRAEDAVCITVRDAGSGVPADKLPQLFEPFFTTKSTGTGLGLALTRSIAEAHDGTVEYAHDNEGTRFTLRIGLKSS